MTENEMVRGVEAARWVIEQLRIVEHDHTAGTRAPRASKLRESLADGVRQVERAITRRRNVERRLCASPGAEPRDWESSLASSEKKARIAFHNLTLVLQRAEDTLASWNVR